MTRELLQLLLLYKLKMLKSLTLGRVLLLLPADQIAGEAAFIPADAARSGRGRRSERLPLPLLRLKLKLSLRLTGERCRRAEEADLTVELDRAAAGDIVPLLLQEVLIL